MKFSFTDHPAFRSIDHHPCLGVTLDASKGYWRASFRVDSHLPDVHFGGGSSVQGKGDCDNMRFVYADTPELLETRCLEFLRAHDDAVRSGRGWRSSVTVMAPPFSENPPILPGRDLRRAVTEEIQKRNPRWSYTAEEVEKARAEAAPAAAKTVEIDGKKYATTAAISTLKPVVHRTGVLVCAHCGLPDVGPMYAVGDVVFHGTCLPTTRTKERA